MPPNIIKIDKVTDKYLTIQETCEYMKWSNGMIRNYLSTGRLTKYLFRNHLVFISKKELNQYRYK